MERPWQGDEFGARPRADGLRALWVGAAAAAVTGLGALALLVRLLRGRQFHWFAGYT